MIEKILTALALCSLLFVMGFIAYDTIGSSDATVIVDLKEGADPFVELRQIMPQSTTITSVRQSDISKNSYIVKVNTRHNKGKLLEWILGKKEVENAEIR